MFSKGSRYRSLPESSVLTAQGERLVGKEMRVISPPAGRFQHTVRDGDRLDLLGFKYYGDAARWWQIADANPQFEFPIDILGRAPIVEEHVVVRHQGFYDRFEDLRLALEEFGEVRVGELSGFEGETAVQEPDFIESIIVVTYEPSPSVRQQILVEINERLHVLKAFAWPHDNKIAEAFTLDDQGVKSQWRKMIASLTSTSGVLKLHSAITEGRLEITYHAGRISRPTIAGIVSAHEFSIEGADSVVSLRAGARIVVPPNQFV